METEEVLRLVAIMVTVVPVEEVVIMVAVAEVFILLVGAVVVIQTQRQ